MMADVIDFASWKLRLSQRRKPRTPIENGCYAQVGSEQQKLIDTLADRHHQGADPCSCESFPAYPEPQGGPVPDHG